MEDEKVRFRYNDVTERYKKMNKVYMIASDSLWVMIIMYMTFKMFSHSIAPMIAYGNIILSIVFSLVNYFIYKKNKGGAAVKRTVAIGIAIEFILIGVQTNAEFIYFTLLGILALQIPYYDMKVYKKFCLIYILSYTFVIVIRAVKGVAIQDVDAMCRTICVYLMFYVLYKVGSVAQMFSDHALGSVEEQSSKQETILSGILDISKTVQDETAKSSKLVDELVTATESVADSMKQIANAANTTATNIEEQNNMTQSIQTAIEGTGERSKKMVSIAIDSNGSIQENMQMMEELKTQSEQIAVTNREVTEAMDRLQNKTKEVEEIAGMILNISSQTNLLALNASIESARAGEAGRGFAVVAEQIRQLAEQTRSSTEEITRIINELNENANEVVGSVQSSVEATESQNEKIIRAAETFEKLNVNMTQLIENINGMDQEILGLSDSNNRIVENISNLSAATQQVTASAEQVSEMSEQNLSYAEDVKEAIGLIQNKTDDMKQYI
ncbi:MAG: methyl-accepting chemotaxis protein [Roseburia sp.]